MSSILQVEGYRKAVAAILKMFTLVQRRGDKDSKRATGRPASGSIYESTGILVRTVSMEPESRD